MGPLKRSAKRIAQAVLDLWPTVTNLEDDAALDAYLAELSPLPDDGKGGDDRLVPLLAAAREIARRSLKDELNAYPQQLEAAVHLHRGRIIEMANGEGKTLAAALVAAVNAWPNRQVHIATYNQYLAERDLKWMGPLYLRMGLRPVVLLDRGNRIGILEYDQPDDEERVIGSPDALQRAPYPSVPHDDVDDVSAKVGEPKPKEVHGELDGFAPSGTSEDAESDEDGHRGFESDPFGPAVDEEGAESTAAVAEAASEDGDAERWEIRGQGYRFWTTSLLLDEGREYLRRAHVVHGVLNDFIFVYLRDSIVHVAAELSFPEAPFWLILDEADHALIEEARTPCNRTREATVGRFGADSMVRMFDVLRSMEPELDYLPGEHTVITGRGRAMVAVAFGVPSLHCAEASGLAMLTRAMARGLFDLHRDVHYIVRNGAIVVVVRETGRAEPGRSYDWGTHEALLLKEGLPLSHSGTRSETLATITVQRFVRLYRRLSGMTGTALAFKKEFASFYDIQTVQVASQFPSRRVDHPDRVYIDAFFRFDDVACQVLETVERRQPVLVDCPDIHTAELLCRVLTEWDTEESESALFAEVLEAHPVTAGAEDTAYRWFCRTSEMARRVRPSPRLLTAKNDAIEARIIEEAGRAGAVTISARMAGRGTDIRIDEEAASLGGLYVIGFARNESRHIDQQIRGRAARQGNPGESVFYISLFTDELPRAFYGEGYRRFFKRLGVGSQERSENRMMDHGLAGAERTLAKVRFHQRRQIFEFDSFLDRQRRFVYGIRRNVLTGADVIPIIEQIARNVALRAVTLHWPEQAAGADSLCQCLEPLGVFSRSDVVALHAQGRERAAAAICDHLLRRLRACHDYLGAQAYQQVMRGHILTGLDRMWQEHLAAEARISSDAFALRQQGDGAATSYQLRLNEDYWQRVVTFEREVLRCALSDADAPTPVEEAPPEDDAAPAKPDRSVQWHIYERQGIRQVTLRILGEALAPRARPWQSLTIAMAITVYLCALWLSCGLWDTARLRDLVDNHSLLEFLNSTVFGFSWSTGGLLLFGLAPLVATLRTSNFLKLLLRFGVMALIGSVVLHAAGMVAPVSSHWLWAFGLLVVLAVANAALRISLAAARWTVCLFFEAPMLIVFATATWFDLGLASSVVAVAAALALHADLADTVERVLVEHRGPRLLHVHVVIAVVALLVHLATALPTLLLVCTLLTIAALVWLSVREFSRRVTIGSYHLEPKGPRAAQHDVPVPYNKVFLSMTGVVLLVGWLVYALVNGLLEAGWSPVKLESTWDFVWPICATAAGLFAIVLGGGASQALLSLWIACPLVRMLEQHDYALRDIPPDMTAEDYLAQLYVDRVRRSILHVVLAFIVMWSLAWVTLCLTGKSDAFLLGPAFAVLAFSLASIAGVGVSGAIAGKLRLLSARESWGSHGPTSLSTTRAELVDSELLSAHRELIERLRSFDRTEWLFFLGELWKRLRSALDVAERQQLTRLENVAGYALMAIVYTLLAGVLLAVARMLLHGLAALNTTGVAPVERLAAGAASLGQWLKSHQLAAYLVLLGIAAVWMLWSEWRAHRALRKARGSGPSATQDTPTAAELTHPAIENLAKTLAPPHGLSVPEPAFSPVATLTGEHTDRLPTPVAGAYQALRRISRRDGQGQGSERWLRENLACYESLFKFVAFGVIGAYLDSETAQKPSKAVRAAFRGLERPTLGSLRDTVLICIRELERDESQSWLPVRRNIVEPLRVTENLTPAMRRLSAELPNFLPASAADGDSPAPHEPVTILEDVFNCFLLVRNKCLGHGFLQGDRFQCLLLMQQALDDVFRLVALKNELRLVFVSEGRVVQGEEGSRLSFDLFDFAGTSATLGGGAEYKPDDDLPRQRAFHLCTPVNKLVADLHPFVVPNPSDLDHGGMPRSAGYLNWDDKKDRLEYLCYSTHASFVVPKGPKDEILARLDRAQADQPEAG